MTDTPLEIEQADGATPEQLSAILNLSRQQLTLAKEVADAEAALKLKKEAYKKCAEITLPNALRDAHLESLPLGQGWTVQLKTLLAGNITEEHKDAAHAWLEDHGMGGIIKHVITITFGRDEDSFFKKFLRDLAKRKRPIQAERKDAVHYQTLAATIREQVAKAQDEGRDPKEAIPFDLLGVFQITTAELIPPKKPKGPQL